MFTTGGEKSAAVAEVCGPSLGTRPANDVAEDIMRDLSQIFRALISVASGAAAAGLCTVNGFGPMATFAVSGMFVLLFWTWLRP